MTDPAPPSIPPKNRPTSKSASAARTVTSPAGRDTGESGQGKPAPTRPVGGQDGGSSAPRDGSKVAPQGPTTAAGSSSGDGPVATPPAADERPSGAPQQDPPTPLMAAVDKTTAWIKKTAGATSAAISTATRPRNEDPAMTTTPTAPPSSAGAAGNPPSVPPRTSTTAPPSSGTTGARPQTGRIPTVSAAGGPRRVRLAISRIDPWSVMKLSFLMSVAFGILLVVAVGVVWYTLNGLHVFTNIDDLVTQVTGTEGNIDILSYVEFKRVISGATLVAVVDVFLLTALATIGAFLYNIVAALVGGLHVTMTDE